MPNISVMILWDWPPNASICRNTETFARSKPSQYASCSTPVKHMIRAILRECVRYCLDASEGLMSLPMVMATTFAIDEVHGKLIFGWYDSHRARAANMGET